MENIIRVIIVDDHKIFRTGLELILNGFQDIKVIGQAANSQQLLLLLKKMGADLIFMDIKMPGMDGIELTRIVSEKYPQVRIIGLTMFGEIQYFNEMLNAGASGFLLKHTQENELEQAIRAVMDGDFYFSEEFRKTFDGSPLAAPRKMKVSLSDREIEILRYICQGYSNNEIADTLHLSPHTVDGHRRNLLSKSGAKNSVGLAIWAIKNGVISED